MVKGARNCKIAPTSSNPLRVSRLPDWHGAQHYDCSLARNAPHIYDIM